VARSATKRPGHFRAFSGDDIAHPDLFGLWANRLAAERANALELLSFGFERMTEMVAEEGGSR
jgi:hypothetical protein